MTVPGRSDDSHSMIPLAGSFTSETSFKPKEFTGKDKVTANEQSPQLSIESERRKQLVEAEESNTKEQGDQSSQQSSQSFVPSNTEKSLVGSESKVDDTLANTGENKKHFDPEKQEQEGMEKADEEKPIQA